MQSIAGTTQIEFFSVKERGAFEVMPNTPLCILMAYIGIQSLRGTERIIPVLVQSMHI